MRWRIVLPVALVAALLLAIAVAPWLRAHRRASDVLRRFSAQAPIARASDERGFDEIDEHRDGSSHFRWYLPRGIAEPPGLVVVHGIHRLAVDEPRLVRFARALASNGVAVLTPDVRELADYRVDARSIETIGAAAHALGAKLTRKVGVMGMSFAGGLSLLAARDPRFRSDIGMVVAVGAHEDAARVARFFATSRIARPDGSDASLGAHGYGVLVFAYAHAERFFPLEDLPIARQALASWLAEERDAARALALGSTPPSRELLERLFDHRLDQMTETFLGVVAADTETLTAVSPHGRLQDLDVPIFLLHGAGDTVIPPSETEWLAQSVPAAALRDVLISRALVHVEPGGQPTWHEQWELLHFVADVLAELDNLSR
jgi:pimeloyl-ACP methyl ester carboxylesterase